MPNNRVAQLAAGTISQLRRNPAYFAVFFVLSVLLVWPVWMLTYPPLSDLPDHGAQLRVITDYTGYRDSYTVNWFTPYLFGYAGTILLSGFMPLTVAIKLTLSIALFAIPVASALLIRSLHGNKWWVLTSFPTAYSFSFYWGFLNFLIAIPLVIGFLAFLNVYAQRPLNRRWVTAAAAFSLVLFFAHGLAWLFAMALAVVVLLSHGHFKKFPARFGPFLLIIPVIAMWFWTASSVSGQNQPTSEIGNITQRLFDRVFGELHLFVIDFKDRTANGSHLNRVKECFSFAIGMPAATDFILLVLLFLGWPFLLGGKLARDWRRHLPFAAVLLMFYFVPYWLFGTAYVYMRIGSLMIPASYFCFTFDPPAAAPAGALSWFKKITPIAIIFAVVAGTLSITRATFEKVRDNERDFQSILAAMEPNRRALQLFFEQDSPFKYTSPYMHYGAWYQVEKHGEVFTTFAHSPDAANVPVHFRGALWPLPPGWNPEQFSWTQHEGQRYDYFLVRSKSPRENLFRDANSAIVLIKQQGLWWLYGRRELKLSQKNQNNP